jgi:hypothetical protein
MLLFVRGSVNIVLHQFKTLNMKLHRISTAKGIFTVSLMYYSGETLTNKILVK